MCKRILTFVVTFIICVLLIGTAVMLLWNWFLPDLFGFPAISWFQALALYCLCNFLFQTYSNNTNK